MPAGKNGFPGPLEVENQPSSERIIVGIRGSDIRPDVIALNTPGEAPAADLIVQSPATHECGVGIAPKIGPLCKAETLPANKHVDPGLEVNRVAHGNMRSAANEKGLRVYAGIGPCASESRDSRAFYTKPVIKISGNIRLVGEIVKIQTQDFELHELEAHTDLPWLAIRRD